MRLSFSMAIIIVSILFLGSLAYAHSSLHMIGAYQSINDQNFSPYRPQAGSHLAIFDLNSASSEELESILGKLIDINLVFTLRSELGSFESIEQVSLIQGIGLGQFLSVEPYLIINKKE